MPLIYLVAGARPNFMTIAPIVRALQQQDVLMDVANNKVVVLKALGGNPRRPYFALLTQTFPQLIAVPRDGLLADASEETLPQGVHMRVLLGEQSALLPDLDALEAALDESFPVAG